jgi:hypothetical protein
VGRRWTCCPLQEATWYIDAVAGEIGQLYLAQTPVQIVQLLNMPPLSEIDVPLVADVLREMVPDLPMPSKDRMRTLNTPLVPVLEIETSASLWLGSSGAIHMASRNWILRVSNSVMAKPCCRPTTKRVRHPAKR